MVSNKEIRRMLGLYAELLQLHGQDEKLARYLSGASYYMRRIGNEVMQLGKTEIVNCSARQLLKFLRS